MTPDELWCWRHRMKWTQVEAAKALDIDSVHLSRMERGVMPIRHVVYLATRALEMDRRAARRRLRRRAIAAQGG